MVTKETIQKLNRLPVEYSKAVESYIDFLLSQFANKQDTRSKTKAQRKPGLLKSKLWMMPDFDAPLKDMKDYI